jgi:hypothetical protein
MKTLRVGLCAVAVSVLFAAWTGPSVFAAPASTSSPSAASASVQSPSLRMYQQVPIDKAIDVAQALLPYLVQDEKGYLHRRNIPAQLRISPSDLDAFEQGMQSYNHLVAQGYLALQNGHLVSLKPLTPSAVEPLLNQQTSSGIAQPVAVGIAWWGLYDRLTEQQTVELEAALGTGSGSAAVIASILGLSGAGAPGALVAGLISGLLAMSAGEILYIDATGGFRGVTVYYSWLWGFGVYHN